MAEDAAADTRGPAEAEEGNLRRRVRCPRHGLDAMREAPADPKTGAGRIMRCTVAGCHMVARLPGAEALHAAILNCKQQAWAAARD